ncbi:GRAM domain-containing protein 2B-like isoform X4 [Drosophila novamexicana]|uniref:GRAM domain-containing protein 2B-like isoform X4 n=1 Tax=Drosophila novamexicana TaxID=47314 RepID=UPI0011E604A7|nr:GRAM domain-containing protein 2B-like isoform X4 [Drosophila novamexicana]
MYRTGSGSALLCLAQSLTVSHPSSWNRHNNNNSSPGAESKVSCQQRGKQRILLKARSTSSVVCTVATGGSNGNSNGKCGNDARATGFMAAQQLPAAGQTAGDNPRAAAAATLSEQQQQQQQQLQQRRQQYAAQLSLPETFGPEHSSLPQSYSSSVGPLQSSGSAQSLASSPSSSARNSQTLGQGQAKGLNTAKQHDQQASAVAAISSTSAGAAAAAAAAASAAAASAGVAATSAAAGGAVAVTPPDKEKKRKEVSSSRVKKFHRHFSQVSKDEKLINYFSCALVGDIPLQGHLYITDEHFAFYSNVFGYVTKVVIPTSSVTKISKEKTAKIIPNAVGVATADERHVFGSFISRESAFRLMCNVCSHLATGAEILPKPLPADVELTEEYLLDDDSSCSISGNESPPQLRDAATPAGVDLQPQMLLRQRAGSDRQSDLQTKCAALDLSHGQVTIRSSAPPIVHYEEPLLVLGGAGSRSTNSSASTSATASSSGPPSSSSSPVTVVGVGVGVAAAGHMPARSEGGRLSRLGHSMRSHLRLRLPTLTELHVLYLGIMLAIMLALFSVFLLYRILDIEAKTSLYNTPVDFSLRSGNDEDIFAEALRWQKELQDKSTAEAQHILSRNLEQISKVRRSLETLSMLIHDRRNGYGQPSTEEEAAASHAHNDGDISD